MRTIPSIAFDSNEDAKFGLFITSNSGLFVVFSNGYSSCSLIILLFTCGRLQEYVSWIFFAELLSDEMAHGDVKNLDQDVSLSITQGIARAAVASLHPLQEDLAEWLTRVLGKAD